MADIDFGSLADYSAGGSGIAAENKVWPDLDIDLREVRRIPKILDYIEKHGGDMRKPLKRFNVYRIGQTDKTFKDGGRGFVKWQPLAPITVIMRAYRARGSGRTNPKGILKDSGILKNAIDSEVYSHNGNWVYRVFNDVPYAKTHQFGGEMKIPERTIRPKKPGGVLFFEMPWGEKVFTRKVVQPAHTKPVPKRPFLFFLEQDKSMAINLFLEHAREVSARGLEQRA